MSDVPTVDVLGHTQQVMDRELDGYRVLPPGSATGDTPATTTSLLVVRVVDGDIAVELRLENGDGR